MFYLARCVLAQLVHTTHKIKSIHAIFYHILLFTAEERCVRLELLERK